MMYTYCLFVETGREALLKAGLQDILPDSVVLVPSYSYHIYKSGGQWVDQRRRLFQGYFFLFAPEQIDIDIVWSARPLGIFKFLSSEKAI